MAPGAFAVTIHLDGQDLVYEAGADEVNNVVASNGPLITDVVFQETSGNDMLTGTPRPDLLEGGPGNDMMKGLGGPDSFIEFSASGANGSDTMQGGSGNDLVSYSQRTRPVIVTLDGRRNDGQGGERDKVGSDVESVEGGKGRDMLTGNRHSNVILGGPGADKISGLAGTDQLFGEGGNDVIRSRDRSRDEVDGGSGTDRASRDSRDRVERVERFF